MGGHRLGPSRYPSKVRTQVMQKALTSRQFQTLPGRSQHLRHAPGWSRFAAQRGALRVLSSPGHRLVCVCTTSGLYLRLHLKVFHSTEYLSLLNSPPHIFFIKQAPKTTNLPVALKVSVYKPLETVCNSLITFSKEVTVYRYTNKCHIRCLSPSNEIRTQGKREWGWWTWDLSLATSPREGRSGLAVGAPRGYFFRSLSYTVATQMSSWVKAGTGTSCAQTQQSILMSSELFCKSHVPE